MITDLILIPAYAVVGLATFLGGAYSIIYFVDVARKQLNS